MECIHELAHSAMSRRRRAPHNNGCPITGEGEEKLEGEGEGEALWGNVCQSHEWEGGGGGERDIVVEYSPFLPSSFSNTVSCWKRKGQAYNSSTRSGAHGDEGDKEGGDNEGDEEVWRWWWRASGRYNTGAVGRAMGKQQEGGLRAAAEARTTVMVMRGVRTGE